ncbi:MAG: type II toxin-antitoxin system Phd/YefM family antitoxin [Anaerolineae bacterium]|nr:type II toxin-antitoxin system Phd/YefM family antitoxin [Anaerolineae bacterium]
MAAKTISVTELKQNLGEIVNQASFGGTRFILLSHGKERAALISVEDLRLLETLLEESQRELYQTQQLNLLAEARQLRESGADQGYLTDSTSALEEVREERLDDLTDLR